MADKKIRHFSNVIKIINNEFLNQYIYTQWFYNYYIIIHILQYNKLYKLISQYKYICIVQHCLIIWNSSTKVNIFITTISVLESGLHHYQSMTFYNFFFKIIFEILIFSKFRPTLLIFNKDQKEDMSGEKKTTDNSNCIHFYYFCSLIILIVMKYST